MSSKKQGCGCANIPISVILIFLGGSYWLFAKYGIPDPNFLLSKIKGEESTIPITPTPALPSSPIVKNYKNPNLATNPISSSATTNSDSQTNTLPNSLIINTPKNLE